jgi:Flp pilus assembly protein TadD
MAERWLRVLWPVALLLVFVTSLRGLSERAQPPVSSVDCDRLPPGDLAALERCVAIRPSDLDLLTDAGAAYERAERWDRAEDAYRRAMDIDPQDGDVRVRLGEVLLRRGDVDGARLQAAAALEVQPGRMGALELMRRAGEGDR